MSKKNTIRLTESDLKRVISESVKKVLKENEEKVLKLQYDENLSRSRGRKYYYCHNNGRYYTNIEGEWYICTDNYYLEPDVHLDDNVRVITESVKKVLKESEDNPFAWDGKYADGGSDMSYDELYDAGVSFKDAWHNFAKAMTRSGFLQNNRQLVEQWYNAQKPLYGITTEIIFHAGGMYKED